MDRVYSRVLLAVVLSLGAAVQAVAGAAPAPLLLRLYLEEGGTLVSYGEYTRTPDVVVFSMPVTGSLDDPGVQVVSLPASAIDWAKTEDDAANARYHHYANTRGEAEYRELTHEVARTLNLIAGSTDPVEALELASRARQALQRWPAEHFGYRAAEIEEFVWILDESIGALRAKLGVGAFDVELTARMAPPAVGPPPAAVTGVEVLNSMLVAARATPRPADRLALLQSARFYLEQAPEVLPARQAGRMRSQLVARIRYEHQTDERYARWAADLIREADEAVRRAKVSDVQAVVGKVLEDDRKMGYQRPDVVGSLLALLRQKQDEASAQRLLLDRRELNRGLYEQYEQALRPLLTRLEKLEPILEQVRRLEGPPPEDLTRWINLLAGGSRTLAQQPVPDGILGAHGKLVGAWNLAERALDTRQAAIAAGDTGLAAEASSAAAGALLLIRTAQDDYRAFVAGQLHK